MPTPCGGLFVDLIGYHEFGAGFPAHFVVPALKPHAAQECVGIVGGLTNPRVPRPAPGESGKEYEMTPYLKPHTAEWFKVLETVNPRQAAHTKHILSLAGSDAVCSICGDESNRDYKLVNDEAAHNPASTMRLCDDCLDVRRTMHSEKFVLVAS